MILSGLSIHVAIATNRLSVVLLEFSSSVKFYKEKKLNLKFGLILGIIAASGSFIGANLVININEKYLNLIIAFAFFYFYYFT